MHGENENICILISFPWARGCCVHIFLVKNYLPKVLNDIEVIGQTVEEHTKKVVQMHYLARNFTAKMKEELIANGKETSFGETFCYKKIYLGKIGDDVYVTVEELVDGTFVKYINNNGDVCGENVELTEKAECLHTSLMKDLIKKLWYLTSKAVDAVFSTSKLLPR